VQVVLDFGGLCRILLELRHGVRRLKSRIFVHFHVVRYFYDFRDLRAEVEFLDRQLVLGNLWENLSLLLDDARLLAVDVRQVFGNPLIEVVFLPGVLQHEGRRVELPIPKQNLVLRPYIVFEVFALIKFSYECAALVKGSKMREFVFLR